MFSFTEENYLKSIVQLTVFEEGVDEVGVNRLAIYLDVKPATVTDMVKKLKAKGLINYQRYGKVSLTEEGRLIGLRVVRKHRLWETFLHDKLKFNWDQIHEIAEQLEHVNSSELTNRLDAFLGFPEFDPHGDAIPRADGSITMPYRKLLNEAVPDQLYRIIAVSDNSNEFLRLFDEMGLNINDEVQMLVRNDYDGLLHILFNGKERTISPKFAENIYVVCAKCGKAKACNCN